MSKATTESLMAGERVLDALTTQGFDHPTRSAFFFSELTEYFVFCRDFGFAPESLKGSYAGAMGWAAAFSSGRPTFRPRAFSTTRLSRSSYTLSSTITREQALHFCPLYPNAACTMPVAAASRSPSAHTTVGSLPPISAMTRLSQRWPGWTFAARS